METWRETDGKKKERRRRRRGERGTRKGKASGNGAVEQNEKERRGSLTLSLESDSSQSQYRAGGPCSHLTRLVHSHCNGYVYPAEETPAGRVIRLSHQPRDRDEAGGDRLP